MFNLRPLMQGEQETTTQSKGNVPYNSSFYGKILVALVDLS